MLEAKFFSVVLVICVFGSLAAANNKHFTLRDDFPIYPDRFFRWVPMLAASLLPGTTQSWEGFATTLQSFNSTQDFVLKTLVVPCRSLLMAWPLLLYNFQTQQTSCVRIITCSLLWKACTSKNFALVASIK